VTEPPLPRQAGDLYALAPEEFTAARNALARRLKGEGRHEDAAAVSTLRRPSRTAWALNQLARGDPGLVAAVLGAGHRLAQSISAGKGRAAVSQAQADERQALSDVVAGAARCLADAGRPATDAALSQMAETVRAAVLDPEVEARLVSGTLESDVSAPGLGLGLGPGDGVEVPSDARAGAVGGARRSASRRDAPGGEQTKNGRALPGERAVAASERRARQARRRQLERDVKQARAFARDASARAEAARARADDLRRRAEEAEVVARDAERALEAEAQDGS
jgi:hypothetical protein